LGRVGEVIESPITDGREPEYLLHGCLAGRKGLTPIDTDKHDQEQQACKSKQIGVVGVDRC